MTIISSGRASIGRTDVPRFTLESSRIWHIQRRNCKQIQIYTQLWLSYACERYLSERSSSPFPLGLYSCTTYTRRDDDDCDNNVNNIPPKLALSHRILASSLPPKLIQLSSVTMRTNRKFENRSLSLPNNICFCFISLRCTLIGTLVQEYGPHLRLSTTTTTTTTTELNHNEEALGRYGDVNWLLRDRKSI